MTARVGRYARVGIAVGGTAARLVGHKYLGMSLDPGKHASQVRESLGGLKGPLMKTAQILSTIPNALPDEYAKELSQLQANAPSMGWLFVKRRMASELGRDWQDKFAHFDREAEFAASLGQVHHAETADGRAVACKLQYPDMSSVVDADIDQLKLFFALIRRRERAVDMSLVYEELSERLREELDYEREAKHTRLYGAMLEKETAVRVPTVIDELSTRRLLTASWLPGTPVAEYIDGPDPQREVVAHNIFRAWYVPFYEYGVIHGDPHLGNYTIDSEDGGINLYDFGCVRVFKPSFVRGVIDLYYALRDDDRERAVHAYETWGFEKPSKELIDALSIWAEFVYSPVMEDRTQKIQEEESGLYGAKVAHKVHAELRRIGGVRPPREFVLMDRAAVGLGAVFMRLRAEVNWYRIFHDLIGDFDEKVLAERQKRALTAHGLGLAE